MKFKLIIGLILIIGVVSIYLWFRISDEPQQVETATSTPSTTPEVTVEDRIRELPAGIPDPIDVIIEFDETQVVATSTEPLLGGQYIAYYDGILDRPFETDVVLFFYTKDCRGCLEANTDIVNNFFQIPNDVTVIHVPYATAHELKRIYGVTIEHTFVQLDQNKRDVKKWAKSRTLKEIIEQVL